MQHSSRLLLKLFWFYVGLVICVSGFALIIKAGLGASPWDIFHLGVAGKVSLSLSAIIQLAGLLVIVLNLMLGIRPSLGTVLNMVSVGPIMQWLLPLISTPDSLIGRWVLLAIGVGLSGVGTAFYVSADLGSGPRDGMMIVLTQRLRLPVAIVKNGLDVIVAGTGWLLGGPLGFGTVVVAMSVGPAIQFGVKLAEKLSAFQPFTAFVHPAVFRR